MHEVDFLPVESPGTSSSKCGDAIAMRFTYEAEWRQVVIVIDGGYSSTGTDVVDHIQKYYNTNNIDLVVSTHPDADHINGLTTVLEQATVNTLMVHQPRLHLSNVRDFSNIEAVDDLLAVARAKHVDVIEPFEGLSVFNGQFTVLGPSLDYYVELMEEYLEEERVGVAAARRQPSSKSFTLARKALDKFLTLMPFETLTNEGDTGPRNNSSVISLLQVAGHRMLFTGDAGIPALEKAANYYEFTEVGPFTHHPLDLIQLPHHGSKRNVGPNILDRILGPQGAHQDIQAVISSAEQCKDHPSPKVVNAASRRGCSVVATEGRTVCHSDGAVPRAGWGPITPIGPLPEDD